MQCSTLIRSGRHSISALCTVALIFASGILNLSAAELQGSEKCYQVINADLVALSRKLPSEETVRLTVQAGDQVTSQPLTLLFQYKDTCSSSEFPVFAISAANDDTHIGELIPAPPRKTDQKETQGDNFARSDMQNKGKSKKV